MAPKGRPTGMRVPAGGGTATVRHRAPQSTAADTDTALADDRDALLAGYGAVLHELAAVTLATSTEAEVRERLDDVLVLTLPPAVLVDLRDALARLRARCGELEVDPAGFVRAAAWGRLAA